MKPLQKITILFFLTYSNLALASLTNPPCHPIPQANLPQYIVGYGSLMQSQSKNKSYPYAGTNIPVIIKGYQRGWFQKGATIGFSTTFLGVTRDQSNQFNGVIFNLPSSTIFLYDKRERNYCREEISPKKLQILTQKNIPIGQFWIYISTPNNMAIPSARYPITQSYVDTFLSGCLEVERIYHLKNFAKNCVDTTQNWSTFWVNDRIFPRRPFIYQPDAMQIDEILYQKLPALFKQIKIE